MSEKWMDDDEYIVHEQKVWLWYHSSINYKLIKTKLYLTNKRLYGKDSWFKIKIFDYPFNTITNVQATEKFLIIEAKVKNSTFRIKIKQKNTDNSLEWMVNERIKAAGR
jgi:hypothetical protein